MTCFNHTGRHHTQQQGLRHTNNSWTEKSVHDLTTTQQKRSNWDEEIRKRDSKYKENGKSYRDRRHRAKEHKFNVREAVLLKCDKKHKGDTPFWTVHLHGHKGNWLHDPCLESQWWENSMPKCIQIQAAQNNLHPSKRETKENTYCKTSSTTSS